MNIRYHKPVRNGAPPPFRTKTLRFLRNGATRLHFSPRAVTFRPFRAIFKQLSSFLQLFQCQPILECDVPAVQSPGQAVTLECLHLMDLDILNVDGLCTPIDGIITSQLKAKVAQ